MDKKIAALLGAAAALTTMSGAQSAVAAPAQNTPPTCYRDLLEPVPDALNALKIDDARTRSMNEDQRSKVAVAGDENPSLIVGGAKQLKVLCPGHCSHSSRCSHN